jgi:hypothetical protein
MMVIMVPLTVLVFTKVSGAVTAEFIAVNTTMVEPFNDVPSAA